MQPVPPPAPFRTWTASRRGLTTASSLRSPGLPVSAASWATPSPSWAPWLLPRTGMTTSSPPPCSYWSAVVSCGREATSPPRSGFSMTSRGPAGTSSRTGSGSGWSRPAWTSASRRGVRTPLPSGCPHRCSTAHAPHLLALGRVKLAAGAPAESGRLARQVLHQPVEALDLHVSAHLLAASSALALGQAEPAAAFLREAIKLAATTGCRRPFDEAPHRLKTLFDQGRPLLPVPSARPVPFARPAPSAAPRCHPRAVLCP